MAKAAPFLAACCCPMRIFPWGTSFVLSFLMIRYFAENLRDDFLTGCSCVLSPGRTAAGGRAVLQIHGQGLCLCTAVGQAGQAARGLPVSGKEAGPECSLLTCEFSWTMWGSRSDIRRRGTGKAALLELLPSAAALPTVSRFTADTGRAQKWPFLFPGESRGGGGDRWGAAPRDVWGPLELPDTPPPLFPPAGPEERRVAAGDPRRPAAARLRQPGPPEHPLREGAAPPLPAQPRPPGSPFYINSPRPEGSFPPLPRSPRGPRAPGGGVPPSARPGGRGGNGTGRRPADGERPPFPARPRGRGHVTRVRRSPRWGGAAGGARGTVEPAARAMAAGSGGPGAAFSGHGGTGAVTGGAGARDTEITEASPGSGGGIGSGGSRSTEIPEASPGREDSEHGVTGTVTGLGA